MKIPFGVFTSGSMPAGTPRARGTRQCCAVSRGHPEGTNSPSPRQKEKLMQVKKPREELPHDLSLSVVALPKPVGHRCPARGQMRWKRLAVPSAGALKTGQEICLK